MTNLTSDQYRNILHNVEGSTEVTPNALNLLRSAVETFYSTFGCYPDVAGASPGSATIFGEQTQFDEGLTFSLATPMATVIVGRRIPGYRVGIVTSADVGKPHKVSFVLSEFPLMIGEPTWLNYLKGVMTNYSCKRPISAFQAAIVTNIPLGVGLGSAGALEVAMFTLLEIMFGEALPPIEKGIACRQAEEDFLDRTFVGSVARICSSTAKDRQAMFIDMKSIEVDSIPFRHNKVVMIVIDSHMRDIIIGPEYLERTKCLKKACEILGVKNLRDVTEEEVDMLEERIENDIKNYEKVKDIEESTMTEMILVDGEWSGNKLIEMVKRVRFYITEIKRVEEAGEAWNEGNVEKFGELMTESHRSLIYDFGFSNPVLEFLVETSLQSPGVLGAKMIGLGLENGGSVAVLVYKENIKEFAEFLIKSYKENEEQLLDSLTENILKTMPPTGLREDKKTEEEKRQRDIENKAQAKLSSNTLKEISHNSAFTNINVSLKTPTLYIINPIAGAKMIFPLKVDLLRSRFAKKIPQPKELIRKAMTILYETYNQIPEVIGLAPATANLFGDFLEYNMGCIISMALPLLTVTLGCRNQNGFLQMKTTSTEVGRRTEFQAPIPSASTLELQAESWINYAVNTTAEFKGNVPGFTAVVESSVPCEIGIHSCAAFQCSIYEFLEGLTRECTVDPIEKAERCLRAENRFKKEDFISSKCSTLRFIPTILCKEGYVLFINCKNLKMANYYLDHPSYVFLLAHCQSSSSNLTTQEIICSIRLCQEAAELLGKDSLINADERHIRCLQKRGVPEEVIRRAQYIISEQQRCIRAVEAIKQDNYDYLGVLMNESHASLRDDFQVSNSEIELIVKLALSVDGVLGAKLVGKGLSSTVLILARLSAVDACIRHIRKNYIPKYDKPSFYVFKPSTGASIMNTREAALIP